MTLKSAFVILFIFIYIRYLILKTLLKFPSLLPPQKLTLSCKEKERDKIRGKESKSARKRVCVREREREREKTAARPSSTGFACIKKKGRDAVLRVLFRRERIRKLRGD